MSDTGHTEPDWTHETVTFTLTRTSTGWRATSADLPGWEFVAASREELHALCHEALAARRINPRAVGFVG